MKKPGAREKKKQRRRDASGDVAQVKHAVEKALAEQCAALEQEHPTFSLRHLDQENFARASAEDRAALSHTLFKLSQLSWNQIHTLHRHKLGFEIIQRKDLRIPFPSHLDRNARLFAFRFNGLKPMIGFRQHHVFFILWLDLDFSAYDHS